MAVALTSLGFKKPDGNELFKQGDNVIADNAQKSDDLIAPALTRLGLAEAALNAGAGGPGLSEDPLNAGLYYFAGPTITADPGNPGLYTF
jgi:hypothetical protein